MYRNLAFTDINNCDQKKIELSLVKKVVISTVKFLFGIFIIPQNLCFVNMFSFFSHNTFQYKKSKTFAKPLDNVTMLWYNISVTVLRVAVAHFEVKNKSPKKEELMPENEISKKDLLKKYGISYGALYRWKRKGLIPEDWFIKRSTVTGQETFFPESLICERIELIQSKKDEASLDELATEFSGIEENNETMLLSTEYGDKNFRMKDVKSVTFIRENGDKIDVLELIKNHIATKGE